MNYPPEYIRLYANPKIGSTFTTGRKFDIRTSTRNFINHMIIKGPNGRKDTETVNDLNTNNIPNHALRNKHHLGTYLDNIHLTIFPGNRDRDHLTIAFKDKSRIFVHYNEHIPEVGKKLGFTTGMEGGMPEPVGGGNAQKLGGVFSVIEKTIQPVILRIYEDPDIQHYIRPDSEISKPQSQSQYSIVMGDTQSTQESQEEDHEEESVQEEDHEEESEIDKSFRLQFPVLHKLLRDLPKISEEPQPAVRRSSSRDPRRDDRSPIRERSRSRGKTKKRKKNKKTKKRKNKKQKKTKKKKN